MTMAHAGRFAASAPCRRPGSWAAVAVRSGAGLRAAIAGPGVGLSLIVLVCAFGCASKPSVYQPELDRDSIRTVVRQHFRAVSACYEVAIDARPGAMGKVMAEWDITPEGAVENARLSEVDPSLAAIAPCLTKEIGTWKFPPSMAKDVTGVKYPFFFDERRPLR